MSAYAISGRGVRALTQLVRGTANVGAPGFSPATVSPDATPPPFTVRWAQSEQNGAWIIYLGADECLYAGGAALTITAGLTAAANYPAGWFAVPNMDGETAVRLSVLTDDATGAIQDVAINNTDPAPLGETWNDYLIANVSRDSSTGKVRIEQLVVGAVMLFEPTDGLDAGIEVTQAPLAPTTDHSNGGIEITFQPTQGGQAVGNPTVVEVWNGADGGGGGGGGSGPDLSDVDPLGVVPSSGNASPGISAAASRSDHVHKMPSQVMLTNVAQVVSAIKFWQLQVRLAFCLTANNQQEYFFFESGANQFFLRRRFTNANQAQILNATAGDGSTGSGTVTLGDSSVYQYVFLAVNPEPPPTEVSSTNSSGRRIASLWWVVNNFLTKVTDQQIQSVKTIETAATIANRTSMGIASDDAALRFSGPTDVYLIRANDSSFQIKTSTNVNGGSILIAQPSAGTIDIGGFGAGTSVFSIVRLAGAPWNYLQSLAPAQLSSADQRTVVSAGWVDYYYQRKLPSGTTGFSGTKTVITNVEWDATSKQIKMTGEDWTFVDGMLTDIESATIEPIDTEPYPAS